MSDFPLDSNALALQLVNFAQSDIVRAVRIYPTTSFIIRVTAGTQYYALDPTVVRIYRAYWWQAAQNGIRVWETSIDELDYRQPSWLNASPNNQPWLYFEDGRQIGLYPPPNTNSPVSGYPYFSLDCSTQHQFSTTSDALPAFLTDVDAWVWNACSRWATMQRHQDAAGFADLASSALSGLDRIVNGTLMRQKPQIRASYATVHNR